MAVVPKVLTVELTPEQRIELSHPRLHRPNQSQRLSEGNPEQAERP
jgi:hypothetical protein